MTRGIRIRLQAALILVSVPLFIAAIWTGDDRWAMTTSIPLTLGALWWAIRMFAVAAR